MKNLLNILMSVIILSLFIFTACDDSGNNSTSSWPIVTDDDFVATAKEKLEIIYTGTDSNNAVTQNITLPKNGLFDTTITWVSDNSSIISTNGIVTRPSADLEDISVSLTATITKGDKSDTKDFTLKVIKAVNENDYAVSQDKAALEIGYNGNDSAESVTQNILLPTSGSNGTIISWVSDNDSMITSTGIVIRPIFGTGNMSITLTATITKGSTSDTKTFTLTVIEAPITDTESVATDKTALLIGYGGTDSDLQVTQNISLPKAGSNSTVISWESDNTTVVNSNGIVVRPIYGSGDTTVTLTATITKGSDSDTKTFTIIVIEAPQTDTEAVALDKENVVIGYGPGDSASSVTQHITLPATGSNGSTISWHSDNPATIQIDGTVTIPDSASDTSVTLTATITKRSISDTKQFTIMIKACFITVWKTDNTGNRTTSSNKIKLPLDEDGTYNFRVDWGDGTTSTITSHDQEEKVHTYDTAGTYTVTIYGQIEGFGFKPPENSYGFNFYTEDSSKLIDVQQWGQVKLHNKGHQFDGCDKLIGFSATVNPDITHITNMSYMFYFAKSFNGDISTWDVSNVTNMRYMFYYATGFTGDLSSWDVSKVTNMRSMFSNATMFNADISSWNVSNVTNMQSMFSRTTAFNADISSWNVSNVTSMRSMFASTAVFNADISNWNVSKVTDMAGMFGGADAFNRDLSSWDVSNVTDMHGMFSEAEIFNGDISTWNVSKVTDMAGMFALTSAFNGNISTWNVSSVTTMEDMFYFATSFNRDLSLWNVSNVTKMDHMFYFATAFNGNISTWNVSSVITMYRMFWQAESFNQDLSYWNVSNVRSMEDMFHSATAFNGDISTWDVSNTVNIKKMFYNATAFNQNLSGWCVSQFSSEPYDFSYNSGLAESNKPVWGTCP